MLILLFLILLTYQFYLGDIMEGLINQVEIDKINEQLKILISSVNNITNGQFISTLRGDVDKLKNDMGYYNTHQPEISEMVLQSSEILDQKKEAEKSVTYDDTPNNETPDEITQNETKPETPATTTPKKESSNKTPGKSITKTVGKVGKIGKIGKKK